MVAGTGGRLGPPASVSVAGALNRDWPPVANPHWRVKALASATRRSTRRVLPPLVHWEPKRSIAGQVGGIGDVKLS